MAEPDSLLISYDLVVGEHTDISCSPSEFDAFVTRKRDEIPSSPAGYGALMMKGIEKHPIGHLVCDPSKSPQDELTRDRTEGIIGTISSTDWSALSQHLRGFLDNKDKFLFLGVRCSLRVGLCYGLAGLNTGVTLSHTESE